MTYVKLPRLFWIPTILVGEYIMVQILMDREGFMSIVKDFGPIGTFLEWISKSRDFNIGFLGWFVAILIFEACFAFKLAWDKNLNMISCLFWFFQTLLLGFSSFEV